jgi:hypothetical protein
VISEWQEADEGVSSYDEPVFDEMLAPSAGAPLDSLVGNLDEPFSQTLLRLSANFNTWQRTICQGKRRT